MMKVFWQRAIPVLMLTAALPGCTLLSPGRLTVKEYDVTVPAVPVPAPAWQVQPGSIGNASGAGQSLLHRGVGGVMTYDERHRLYQPVETILVREIRRCFGPAEPRLEKTEDFVRLSGTILKFEIDDVGKCAVLEMDVVLELYRNNSRRSQVRRIIRCQAALKDDSTESVLTAQGQCIGQLLAEIGCLTSAKKGLLTEI